MKTATTYATAEDLKAVEGTDAWMHLYAAELVRSAARLLHVATPGDLPKTDEEKRKRAVSLAALARGLHSVFVWVDEDLSRTTTVGPETEGQEMVQDALQVTASINALAAIEAAGGGRCDEAIAHACASAPATAVAWAFHERHVGQLPWAG